MRLTASFVMNRRSLLGGAAALAGAAFVPGAIPTARSQTLTTGTAELTIISDGGLTLPAATTFPDVPQDELRELLTANGLATDALYPDCNVTIVRSGDRLIVFDTGAGPNFISSTGRLIEGMTEAGIDPDEVTDVIFTHAHPDHLWGLTDDFDELVFAQADYHIGQAEWDFWSAPDLIDMVPEDRQSFVVGAQTRFAALDGRVNFLKDGDEVLPDIEVVATPGHTPGHLSFMVHGAEPVLIVGDAISNAVISFERPDWPTASDHDPEEGARTRRALLDRLAAERARIVGFHFPHPGAGYVEKRQGGFIYIPA